MTSTPEIILFECDYFFFNNLSPIASRLHHHMTAVFKRQGAHSSHSRHPVDQCVLLLTACLCGCLYVFLTHFPHLTVLEMPK